MISVLKGVETLKPPAFKAIRPFTACDKYFRSTSNAKYRALIPDFLKAEFWIKGDKEWLAGLAIRP